MGRRVVAIGAMLGAGIAGLGFALVSVVTVATAASASTTIDVRGSWAEIATSQGASYPQTVTWLTENFSTGALTGSDVGGGATFTMTGTINGSKITTHLVEDGDPSYTSDSVGIIDNRRRGHCVVRVGAGQSRCVASPERVSAGHP